MEALKKKKKNTYFAMIGEIRDILLPLAIMVKNISFGLLIPPFLSLGISLFVYHCICTANYYFILYSQCTVYKYIKKIYLKKKQLYKQKLYIKLGYIQYFTVNKSFIFPVNGKNIIQGKFFNIFF